MARIKALLNSSQTTGDVAGISAFIDKCDNLVRVHHHNLLVRAKNLNLEVAGNIAREDSKLAAGHPIMIDLALIDQLETESLELADIAFELACISLVLAGMSKRLLQRTIAAHCTRS